MKDIIVLETERLRLRPWRKQDRACFAALNADPDVMQYYPRVLTTSESYEMAQKLESLLSENGWGFWVVETIKKQNFIGFVGLNEPKYELPVTPCVEIGWRLAKEYWGYGYATEAAKACLGFAFETLHLSEIYSFTSVSNNKSRAVMERLKMINTGENFEHPMIPENHPLREHVLFKIDKQRWLQAFGGN